MQPIAAATRNKPESLRELRKFRNYVKPKVTSILILNKTEKYSTENNFFLKKKETATWILHNFLKEFL